MEDPTDQISRRGFIGATTAALGAAALGSPAESRNPGARSPQEIQAEILSGRPLHDNAEPRTPAVIQNPNILVIMVDQMFVPSADYLNLLPNGQATFDSAVPFISWLRRNSISFQQHYTAAIACTPSRGTHVTGLYSDQTCIYTTQSSSGQPNLDVRFPTFGSALPIAAAAYQPANITWIGKWHLSNQVPGIKTPNPVGLDPYSQYGFQFRQSPATVPAPFGGPYPNYVYPSPGTQPNEGQQPAGGGVSPPHTTNPGSSTASYEQSDPDIEAAFEAWYAAAPPAPWLTVVSFVNPHDISFYPLHYYGPPAGDLPPVVNPQNPPFPYFGTGNPYVPLEDAGALGKSGVKPILQYDFAMHCTNANGPIPDPSYPTTSWTDFLNYYMAMMSMVDTQVGKVYTKFINQSNPSLDTPNTIVVFTSDHGDYAGSHSLREKSGAVYETAIHTPLYVHFPSMRSGNNGFDDPALQRNQLTSSVDFCPMILEMATGNANLRNPQFGPFPDWANRQSLYYYIFHPSQPETRVTTIGKTPNTPYILHATDEDYVTATGTGVANPAPKHVRCLRTKAPLAGGGLNPNPRSGAKFATYNVWTCRPLGNDPTVATQYEFYDYTNNSNVEELGNDTPSKQASVGAATCPTNSSNPSTQLFCGHLAALGARVSGQPPTGLYASEFFASLTGNAIKWVAGFPTIDPSTPLSAVNAAAATAYQNYQSGVPSGCNQT